MKIMKIETREDIEAIRLLMLAGLLALFLLGAYLTPSERLLAGPDQATAATVAALQGGSSGTTD